MGPLVGGQPSACLLTRRQFHEDRLLTVTTVLSFPAYVQGSNIGSVASWSLHNVILLHGKTRKQVMGTLYLFRDMASQVASCPIPDNKVQYVADFSV
jgi:hypothetical protein